MVWADEILIQESCALTDPGPLHGCRAALFRTLHRLRWGRRIYEKDQREGAKIQLEAVLAFFDLFRSLGTLQGDMPLRALLRGLESLDRGAVEPMLKPAKHPAGGRPVNLQWVLVRGFAAARVELARRAGRNLPKACDFVAERLDERGFRLAAAGHGNGRITGATVRAWRREARERAAGDPLRDIYEKLLVSGHSFTSDGGGRGLLRCSPRLGAQHCREPPGFNYPEKSRKPGLFGASGRVLCCPCRARSGGKIRQVRRDADHFAQAGSVQNECQPAPARPPDRARPISETNPALRRRPPDRLRRGRDR